MEVLACAGGGIIGVHVVGRRLQGLLGQKLHGLELAALERVLHQLVADGDGLAAGLVHAGVVGDVDRLVAGEGDGHAVGTGKRVGARRRGHGGAVHLKGVGAVGEGLDAPGGVSFGVGQLQVHAELLAVTASRCRRVAIADGAARLDHLVALEHVVLADEDVVGVGGVVVAVQRDVRDLGIEVGQRHGVEGGLEL